MTYLLQATLSGFATKVDFRLDVGWILVTVMPFKNTLIVGIDLLTVMFDVVDGRLCVASREPEQRGNAVAWPGEPTEVRDV